MSTPPYTRLTALYDYAAKGDTELSCSSGECLQLLCERGDWWYCQSFDGRKGYVPERFLKKENQRASISLPRPLSPLSNEERERLGKPPALVPPSPRGRSKPNPVEKKKKLIEELLQTEQSYVNDLEVAVRVFLQPIRDKQLLPGKQEVAALFSNIEAILDVHQQLLADLKLVADSLDGVKLSNCFLKYCDLFKFYAVYCSNQPFVSDRIEDYSKLYPEFKLFLEECFNDKRCRKLGLQSFLILPLQRICKYPLFFRDMIAVAAPRSEEMKKLSKAFNEINDVLTKSNERTRRAEEAQQLSNVAKEIVPTDGFDVMVLGRHLVKRGPAQLSHKLRPQLVYLFLFNDVLLICKEKEDKRYRMKKRLKISMISVHSVKCSTSLEVTVVGEKAPFHLTFVTQQEGNEWLEAFKSLGTTPSITVEDTEPLENPLDSLPRTKSKGSRRHKRASGSFILKFSRGGSSGSDNTSAREECQPVPLLSPRLSTEERRKQLLRSKSASVLRNDVPSLVPPLPLSSPSFRTEANPRTSTGRRATLSSADSTPTSAPVRRSRSAIRPRTSTTSGDSARSGAVSPSPRSLENMSAAEIEFAAKLRNLSTQNQMLKEQVSTLKQEMMDKDKKINELEATIKLLKGRLGES